MRRMLGLAVAGVLAAMGAHADPVADWYEAAGALTGADIGTTPGQAVLTEVNSAAESQVALAMFEAANAADPHYRSYLGFPRATRPASAEVAAAKAARDVLVACFPAKAADLDQSLAFNLARAPDGPAKAEALALGAAAANAVMARAAFDRAMPMPSYRPLTQPGRYIPAVLPVIPQFQFVAKPWFLARVDEMAPPLPPPLTSARYARDLNETKRLGGKTSTERTPAQTALAHFFVPDDPTPTMRAIGALPGRNIVQNARMYARYAMAEHDAGIAVSVAKLSTNRWRPITAIRNADEDGNPATAIDAAWEPLLRTPNHPEFPCGHCSNAAVTATILAAETGETPPRGVAVFTTETMPGASYEVRTWTAYADEVSMSRIYGGVHFRFSNEAAQAMGRAIAKKALAGYMQPL